MQLIKKVLFSILAIFFLTNANGYSKEEDNSSLVPVVIKIGVIQDLDSQVLEYTKQILSTKYNITLEIVPFGNINSANKAVSDGRIDGNIAQTEPSFNSYLSEYQYNIASLGKVYVRPMGLYSRKYGNLASVPKDATVVLLESDMDNTTILGRELLLLQKAELLSLKNNPKIHTISTFDVIQDNRKVLFKNALTETALLESYTRNEADLFILDQNVASKIENSKDNLLFSEDVSSAYPRILVVKMSNKNIKYLRQVYDVITSSDTSNYIRKTYHGDLLPIN